MTEITYEDEASALDDLVGYAIDQSGGDTAAAVRLLRGWADLSLSAATDLIVHNKPAQSVLDDIRAARLLDEAKWCAGDALREATDADSRSRAAELEGFTSLTVEDLRLWRDTAAAFSSSQRRPTLSFDVHAAAGDPQMLDRAVTALKKLNRPISPTAVAWVVAFLRGDYATACSIFQQDLCEYEEMKS